MGCDRVMRPGGTGLLASDRLNDYHFNDRPTGWRRPTNDSSEGAPEKVSLYRRRRVGPARIVRQSRFPSK